MVAFAPLKEETSAKVFFISKVLGYYTGDYRLASAYYIIQPEYIFAA
jgi:hypothetical protein